MDPNDICVVKELPSCTIYKRRDGIVVLRQAEGKENLSTSEIEEQFRVLLEIQNGQVSPYLSVAEKLIKLENDQKMLIRACLPEFANKAALVTNHSMASFIFNIFLFLYRPSIPCKIFNSEAKALNWLKEK